MYIIHVNDLYQCEQIQARVQELEKELEDKENGLLRDLRSSKKFKADHIKSGNVTANSAFTSSSPGYENKTNKLDEVMQDPCNDKTHFDRLKSESGSVLNAQDNLDNKDVDVIDLEANDSVFGDEQKAQFSAKPFGTDDSTPNSENKSSLCQNDDRHSVASECTTAHAANGGPFLKHREATVKSTFMANIRAKLHIPRESPSVRTNATSSTLESEILTIDGISKQATRLASGTGPQQIHNFSSLSGEIFCCSGNSFCI
jgi:TRAF-interacting protein